MKIACYTDIHNQQVMLNYPTTLRKSAVIAAEKTLEEFGKADLSVIGGDNLSDYPYWNRSCALPYKNWLDIKEKLVKNFARTAKGEKVLYVGGNNDPIMGDFPTRDNPPYNTCEFYESGPMKETLGELADGEYYGVYAKAKGPQAGLYHLAFHYVIDGIDFFGLNVDPDDAFDNHDCGYNRESLVWLKEKLRTVDPEGNKLIFVVGHLSVTSRMTDGTICGKYADVPHRKWLLDAFAGHKNLFYLYGHVHGQDYLRSESWQGLLHFDENGDLIGADHEELTEEEAARVAFHTVHMGGLRPFAAKPFEFFEEDGLTGMVPGDKEPRFYECTGTPKIGQYLMIETTDTAVDFSYRNTGSLPGYTVADKPKTATVLLR